MHRKFHRAIGMIFFVSYCACAGAARDVSQLHLHSNTGDWSLGTGFRYGMFPYVGEETEHDFLPLITYSGEHFFIDGTRTGFHLYDTEDWLVGTYVAYRFGGFNEDDSKKLDGMDRDDGVDGRFAITRKTSFGDFTMDTGADIRDKSNGWDAQLRWGKTLGGDSFLYRPWIGLTYEDQNLVNYYYGVKSSEATAQRPAYETDSALEWSYGIDTSYRLSQHHYVGLNLQYTQLDSTKLDSPIVEENGIYQAFLSYRYEYNDYRDDPTVSGGLLRDLTKGEYYWRVAAGRTTKATFNKLMRFQDMFDPEERDTGLASVFVGKKIADEFLWLPMEGYVTGGLVRRFERGEQDDFNEYVLAFKGYYSDFPWSNRVKTRVGIAEGISYADSIPIVERENVERKNRSGSNLLNYLDLSWDFSIGDLFQQASLRECYFGWSVHHRSGIFGSSDFLGNVDGGGNVNTLYLQCHNRG
jgi:outer membrane protein